MAHEPKALNAWAPEIVWDAAKSQYLVFWSSTIPGRFPDTDESGSPLKEGGRTNHRIYSTTTKDFRTWTPTQVFYDDGFNVDRRDDRATGRSLRDGGEGRDTVSHGEETPARRHVDAHRRPLRTRVGADLDRLGGRAVAAAHG